MQHARKLLCSGSMDVLQSRHSSHPPAGRLRKCELAEPFEGKHSHRGKAFHLSSLRHRVVPNTHPDPNLDPAPHTCSRAQVPGLVNVDFADVRTIMAAAGTSLMGQGRCSGKQRAREAALAAISSPLLDIGIERATGIVWNITGPPDLTLFEVPASSMNSPQDVRPGCLLQHN